MLIIRNQQLEKFRDAIQGPYLKRMADRLINKFPAETKEFSENDLYAYIREHTRRAKSYGLRREADIRSYLDYTFVLSPDFDCHPRTAWAKSILNARNLDGASKMARINDYFTFELKGKA